TVDAAVLPVGAAAPAVMQLDLKRITLIKISEALIQVLFFLRVVPYLCGYLFEHPPENKL
ncbi:hypothetical protein CRENBAI_000635, partial [Crenichthys baileyi]